MYPVLISSLGVVVEFVTLNLRCVIYRVHDEFCAVDVVLSWMILPDKSNLCGKITVVRCWYCVLAIVLGLWSGQFLLLRPC